MTYLIYIMGIGGHTDGCNLLRTRSFTKLLRVASRSYSISGDALSMFGTSPMGMWVAHAASHRLGGKYRVRIHD